jgi:quinol monooxygenase YgiN
VPTPADGSRELLPVIAFMRGSPRQARGAEGGDRGSDEATKREDGYVNHDLDQGVEDPDFLTFYENWGSGDEFDAHLAAPHLVDFAVKMGDLLDDVSLSINRVRRIA